MPTIRLPGVLLAGITTGDLRRAQIAWALAMTASGAHAVALSVLAFDRGGAHAVGLVLLVRSLPAVPAAPLMAAGADRLGSRLLPVSATVASVALGATAVAAALALPLAVAALLGAVLTTAMMAFRQAHAALLARLASSQDRLTAANAAATAIEATGLAAGPAVAAVLIAAASPAVALSACGIAAALAAAVSYPVAAASRSRGGQAARSGRAAGEQHFGPTPLDRRAAGAVRLVFALVFVQTVAGGAMAVLVVVYAAGPLALGSGGAGTLMAAYGTGGVLGGALVVVLAARADLVRWLCVGLVLLSAPLAALAAVPEPVPVIALLLVVGIGNALFDVAHVTLLARLLSARQLGRALGLLEGVVVLGLGLGALLAPAAVAALGVRLALVATGALLPLALAVNGRALRGLRVTAAGPAAGCPAGSNASRDRSGAFIEARAVARPEHRRPWIPTRGT